MTREYTCMAVDLIAEGVVAADVMLRSCLVYMSESDVRDMLESEGYIDAGYTDDE